jgi:regulatory protein
MNKEVLSYLYKLITKKDYTEYEIRVKLYNKFKLEDVEINEIINKLKKENLIDDLRYAKIYIEHKLHKGYGPLYIIEDIKKRGINIDEKFINNILDTLDINLKDIINNLLAKKHINTVEKKYAFLQRRGFKSEKIKELLNGGK